MHWEDRIDNYVRETGFPKSLFIAADGRVVGTWIMGNDYRVKSSYYGGYPAGYLRRIRALFPDKHRVLHLFSGKVDLTAFPGDTVDIDPQLHPTYIDDAQSLRSVPLERYELVMADPPYSVEDAEHYGTSMVKRNRVMRALQRLPPDAPRRVAGPGFADVSQGHVFAGSRDRYVEIHQSSLPRHHDFSQAANGFADGGRAPAWNGRNRQGRPRHLTR